MKYKRYLIICAVLLSITSCSTTQAQRNYTLAIKNLNNTNGKFKACVSKTSNNVRYKNILDNLALKGVSADLKALSNDALFSKEEKNNFLELYSDAQKCEKQKIIDLGEVDREFQLIYVNHLKNRDKVYLSWIESESITYGQINKDIEKLREDEKQKNLDWAKAFERKLSEQHVRELQTKEIRKAEVNEFVDSTIDGILQGLAELGKTQNSLANQQSVRTIVPVTPSIVHTNCTQQFSDTINCTSIRY